MDDGTIIKGFIDFSLLDWPGKVCAVAFLPGCNFRCPFCHNHPLVLSPSTLPGIPLEEVIRRAKARPGWIDGIVISGGEPTLHPALPELLLAIKGSGLMVKLDTNGSRPEILGRLMDDGLVDHVAMDVKAPLEPLLYSRLAGVEVDLGAIRGSIAGIIASGLPYTFRTTVIPGILGEGEVRRLAGALAGATTLVLQNFRPADALDPSWRSVKPLDEERLSRLRAVAGEVLSSPPAGSAQGPA